MEKMNIMAIGAHPDDCEYLFGGTAVKYKALGHRVMFLSMTNGCSGHHLNPGVPMTARRYNESQAVTNLTGIEYKLTDIPDGFLTGELRYRDIMMHEIRSFKPDIIFTHRPNDYHPDHRATGTLLMDCSYLVGVPHILPDSPPLKKAPLIFYMYDNFTWPCSFIPDIAVAIDDVITEKTAMMNCHVSQVYEWLPYIGSYEDEIPQQPEERIKWLKTFLQKHDGETGVKYKTLLQNRYGTIKAKEINYCEAFQLCEYGAKLPEARNDRSGINSLFPM